jgi:hypothetical protein
LGKPQWFPHYQRGLEAKKQEISGRSGGGSPGIFCFFAGRTTAFYIKQRPKPADYKRDVALRFSFTGFYWKFAKIFLFGAKRRKENFLQITAGVKPAEEKRKATYS